MRFAVGTFTGFSAPYTFVVRMDFDRTVSDVGLDMVSGDVFQGNSQSSSQFLGSFKSASPIVSADQTSMGAVFDSQASLQGSIACTLIPNPVARQPPHISVRLAFLDGLGHHSLILQRTSPYLRTFECEVDFQQGVPDVALLTQLRRQVQERLARARIGMYLTSGQSISSPLQDWREEDLRALVDQGFFSLHVNGPQWKAYLFVANFFRETQSGTTTGIMFDRHDDRQRQACAVFWSGIAGLQNGVFERDFVRTSTHELGHVFNLRHSFERGANHSLSFMNYPHEYYGGGHSAAYHEGHNGRFDTVELRFMRHWPLSYVIMGGRPFGGGPLDSTQRDIAQEASRDGLRLELRFKPDNREPRLEFGSPVTVEVKLENLVRDDREVADTLDPAHGETTFIIHKPSGQAVTYSPLWHRCSAGRTTVLSPDCDALYEAVNLTYGSQGFNFMEPGMYKIQAFCQRGVFWIASNILSLWMRYPTTDVEDIVVPTFTSDAGKYLSFWGSRRLLNRMDAFRALSDRLPNHPLAKEFARCRAYEALRPAIVGVQQNKGQGLSCMVAAPEIEDAVKTMRQLLHLTPKGALDRRKSKGILSNIHFSHLAGTLARLLQAAGETQQAENALQASSVYHARHNRKKMPTHIQTALAKRWRPDEFT
jgi:hypothetical protein